MATEGMTAGGMATRGHGDRKGRHYYTTDGLHVIVV